MVEIEPSIMNKQRYLLNVLVKIGKNKNFLTLSLIFLDESLQIIPCFKIINQFIDLVSLPTIKRGLLYANLWAPKVPHKNRCLNN